MDLASNALQINLDLFWKQDFHQFLMKSVFGLDVRIFLSYTNLSVRKSEGGVGPTVGVEDAA
jgi:hypothetical protein